MLITIHTTVISNHIFCCFAFPPIDCLLRDEAVTSSSAISSSSDKSSDRTIPEALTDPLTTQNDYEPLAPRIWKRGGSLRTRSAATGTTSSLNSTTCKFL